MSAAAQPGVGLACIRCEVVVERCAFCEREDCPQTTCYRCLRIAVGQSIAVPHAHGG